VNAATGGTGVVYIKKMNKASVFFDAAWMATGEGSHSARASPATATAPTAQEASGPTEAAEEAEGLRRLRECLTPGRQFDVDPQEFSDLVSLLGRDGLARCVSRIIAEDRLPFPFKRTFLGETLSVEERIENLRRHVGPAANPQPRIPYSKVVSKAGGFWQRHPPTYRGRSVVLGCGGGGGGGEEEGAGEGLYAIDVLSDFFLEGPRVASVGYGEQHSPLAFWERAALHGRWLPGLLADPATHSLSPRILREWLYAGARPRIVEARQGRPTVYVEMFRVLRPRRVLDVAAAWGDRLLAAIAHGLDRYVGVDANPDLAPGYAQILDILVPAADRHRFQMLIGPSEAVALPEGERYDLALMSPAPYRTETYSNPTDQASNYATYEGWLVDYFFATLRRAWDRLADGGSLAITILDRTDRGRELHYVEAVQLYIQYKLRYAVPDGAIWWSGSAADVPFWMWRKDRTAAAEDGGADGVHEARRLEAKALLKKHYGAVYWAVVRQEQAGDDDPGPRTRTRPRSRSSDRAPALPTPTRQRR
jgi:hypothetical protein